MREITREDLAQVCQILGIDSERVTGFTLSVVPGRMFELTITEPVRLIEPVPEHDPF